MVPAARQAHFDHVDGELSEEISHPFELIRLPRGTGRLVQLIAEDPRDQRDSLLGAHRTRVFDGLAVISRRLGEVRVRVADVVGGDMPCAPPREQRPAAQGVVDDLPLVSHENSLRALGRFTTGSECGSRCGEGRFPRGEHGE